MPKYNYIEKALQQYNIETIVKINFSRFDGNDEFSKKIWVALKMPILRAQGL